MSMTVNISFKNIHSQNNTFCHFAFCLVQGLGGGSFYPFLVKKRFLIIFLHSELVREWDLVSNLFKAFKYISRVGGIFGKMKYYFLLVCIQFTVLKADTLLPGGAYYSLFSYNGEGYLYPFPEKCIKLLDEFADYASNFTKCSIHHARPIRLCEKCIDHYVQFDGKYQELLTTVVNGTSCRSVFISHDRLDAVLDYHDNILSVWNKANCKTCFDWTSNTPQLLNSTKRFNKMFNDTMTCILDNISPDGNNSEEVCQKCMQTYIQLDEYYKSLSVDAIGVDSICMDIVDSMNSTRSIWSKGLNCCQLRRTPELIFLCCTGIISFLPILFYLAVRFCGPIRDLPKVLRQSRFKQSFLQRLNDHNGVDSNTGGIN